MRRDPDALLEVDPHELPRLGPVRIIDVREPDEFDGKLGHIPGAELVPLATVERAARGWNPDEPLVMVCRSGGRSGRAVRSLQQRGFSRVYNLRGGMLLYRDAMRSA